MIRTATIIAISCVLFLAVRYFILSRRLQASIRKMKDQQVADRRARQYFQISSETADAGLVVQAMDGRVIWANPAYYRMMKRTEAEVIGKNPLSFAFAPDKTPSAEEIAKFRYDRNDYAGDTNTLRENIRGDGTLIWVQINVTFHDTEDGETNVVLVCRDVTKAIAKEKELHEASETLAHIAAHDALTGVANRTEFNRFIDHHLKSALNNGTRVGLLHIDLDRFKQINDTYGHPAGDAVLIAVADRMRAEIRENDMIARLGGDEFAVVCPGLHDLVQLQAIGNSVVDAVSAPIVWQDIMLTCEISIGAVLSHDTADSADDMLIRSDFALYDVKRNGRGRVATYNRELHRRHSKEIRLAAELKEAVLGNDLTFHYQPILDFGSGDIRGVETLVRWQHPTEGLIAPDDFLPLARATGLMAKIDLCAMNAALDLKLRLNAGPHRTLRVGVNASAELLTRPDMLTLFNDGLHRRGLTSADMVVEVLETVAFQADGNENPYVTAINALNSGGFVTVLDDFGIGHAGLAHLAQLNIKGVKIDRSLTRNVLHDPTAAKIVGALIDLCNDLGLLVTTEGVETADQARYLATLGGDIMQGYLFSRPLPEDQLFDWLDSNAASAIAPDPAPRYLRANS